MVEVPRAADCQNTDTSLQSTPMPQSVPVPPGLLNALRTDAWFLSCPADLQEAMPTLGRLWLLGHGEALFARGGAAQGVCCVIAGALRVGSLQADGSESLLAYVEPYQWFGEVSLIDDLPRTHNAVADGDTTVLVVPQDTLHDWLDQHPAHWRDFARLACAKLRTAFSVLEDNANLTLEQRLVRQLQLVSHGYGMRQGPARRQIRLPQEQLALMLGVSRQSVNKALQALEAKGAIALRYGTIELLSIAPTPPLA